MSIVSVCSAHALFWFTPIFSVHAHVLITIPGGASVKPAAAAVGVHVEASEIQEVVNVTVTAAMYTCELVLCQL